MASPREGPLRRVLAVPGVAEQPGMPTKPIPGSSTGTWGQELNDFLDVAHNTDGTLKAAGGSSGMQTTLSAGTTVGASAIVTVDSLNIAVGQYVAIGALTTSCEIRRVTAVAGTNLTLATSGTGGGTLKIVHSTADKVYVLQGAQVPPEWFGCRPVTSFDSAAGLMQMVLDQATAGGWVIASGGAFYASSWPLCVNDGSIIDNLRIQAFSPFGIDATLGFRGAMNVTPTVGTEPDQYLMMLAGQFGTLDAVDTSTNQVTLSADPGEGFGEKVAFYPRTGSTLPGGLEVGRHYYVGSDYLTSGIPGRQFTLNLNQFSGSAVDITSAGTGSFVWFSPGGSRLKWRDVHLYGGIDGLNGCYAVTQQPSRVYGFRAENFPGPQGCLVTGAQEGHWFAVQLTDGTVGLRCRTAQFVYINDINCEHNDTNILFDDTYWALPTTVGNNQNVLLAGGHFETAGVDSVSRRQRIVGDAAVSAGTFTITFRGQTTAAIARNASAATVQTAVELLSTVRSTAEGGPDFTFTDESGGLAAGGNIIIDVANATSQYKWANMAPSFHNYVFSVTSTGLTGGTYSTSRDLTITEGRNISLRQGQSLHISDCVCNSGAAFFTRESVGLFGTRADTQDSYTLESIICTGATGYAYDDKKTGFQIAWADSTEGACSGILDYLNKGGLKNGSKHEGWVLQGQSGARAAWESVQNELRLRSAKLRFGDNIAPSVSSGSGAPTANEPVGSLYLRTDGGTTTSLYVKTVAGAGAGNWTAK